jgi:hypothetical protein
VRQCGGLGVLDNLEAISATEGLAGGLPMERKVYGSVSRSRLDLVTHSRKGFEHLAVVAYSPVATVGMDRVEVELAWCPAAFRYFPPRGRGSLGLWSDENEPNNASPLSLTGQGREASGSG